MAHKSITDLAPLVSAADGDMLVVVDVSDTTMSVAGTTKKATRSVLLNGVLTANQTITLSGDVTGSGTTAITATLATVPIAKGGTGQVTAADAFTALKQAATTSATGVVELATDGESAANLAVQANDARLSNARTPVAHVHGAADVSSGTLDIARLPVASTGVIDTTKVVRSDDQRLSDARTPTTHNHDTLYYTEAEVTAYLAGKSNTGHTHAISDTTSLQAALDSKSSTSHLHDDRYYTEAEADALLAAKANSSHTHAIADTTGLQAAIDGKAASVHTHSAADVTSGTLDIARLPVATSGTSNSTQVPRADDSRLSNSRAPNGSASGDLSGTYPSPVVAKIQGRAVNSTAPTSGQVLAWNSGTSQWTPTTGGGGGSDATSIQTVPVSSSTPTGGQALRYSSINSQWQPTALGTAADVNTSDAAFNANSIQGTPVTSSAPSDDNILRYNSTAGAWIVEPLGTAADSNAGDAVFNASSIQSNPVANITPVDGQLLRYSSTYSQWEPSAGIDPNTAKTNVAQDFTAGQRGTIVTLTDGATITADFADGNNFSVILGGNRTFGNPINVGYAQSGSIFIRQDGTGSRTLAWGSHWHFQGGIAPSLSTAANAKDRVDYITRVSGEIHAVVTRDYH